MIKAENFSKEVADALRDYTDKMIIGVKNATDEAAKETLTELKHNITKAGIKKHRGRYKRGFQVLTTYENSWIKVNTIHNTSDYQLTHLLENGHATRNGRMTRAFPHIKPTAEAAAARLIKVVTKLVSMK